MHRHSNRGQAGFTMVELLVAVAVIGLLSTVAIPALQNAMLKAKRNAALSELKNLREALKSYAADTGHYPLWGDMDPVSLDPLVPVHVREAGSVTHNLLGDKLDWYIPWNILEVGFESGLDDLWDSPQSFTIMATLSYDQDIKFLVTDGGIYYYINYEIIPISEMS